MPDESVFVHPNAVFCYANVTPCLFEVIRLLMLARGAPTEWTNDDRAIAGVRSALRLHASCLNSKANVRDHSAIFRMAHEKMGLPPTEIYNATGSMAVCAHEAAMDFIELIDNTAAASLAKIAFNTPLESMRICWAQIRSTLSQMKESPFARLEKIHRLLVIEVKLAFDADDSATNYEPWTPTDLDLILPEFRSGRFKDPMAVLAERAAVQNDELSVLRHLAEVFDNYISLLQKEPHEWGMDPDAHVRDQRALHETLQRAIARANLQNGIYLSVFFHSQCPDEWDQNCSRARYEISTRRAELIAGTDPIIVLSKLEAACGVLKDNGCDSTNVSRLMSLKMELETKVKQCLPSPSRDIAFRIANLKNEMHGIMVQADACMNSDAEVNLLNESLNTAGLGGDEPADESEGTDDYSTPVVKIFATGDAAAEVIETLRVGTTKQINNDEISINLARGTISYRGKEILVSEKPLKLIEYVTKQPSQAAKNKDVELAVWGEQQESDNPIKSATRDARRAFREVGYNKTLSRKNGFVSVADEGQNGGEKIESTRTLPPPSK